jgi:hypothetical protein
MSIVTCRQPPRKERKEVFILYYEVTRPSGDSSIIQADSCKEAKAKVCKDWNILHGSITVQKLNVDFPECVHRFDDEGLSGLKEKSVMIFDSHHGSAVRIHAASLESILYFLDEYSTVVVL